MTAQFSGIVKLSDVNDFISASQECILTSPTNPSAPPTTSTKPVQISLRDCLACSGCVTSAETALLENQSAEDVLRQIADPQINVIISISSQARAALAVAFDLTPTQAMKCLAGFLRWLGVNYVFDLNDANDLTLIAATREFIQGYEQAKDSRSLRRCLLASACPGWVCYVEKTHGEWCLRHLAKTRSAQATMGKLVKSLSDKPWSSTPDRIYHCTLMSCFDKKLEASRPQFQTATNAVPEVDACLTSTEMISLIHDQLTEEQSFDTFADSDGAYVDTLCGEKDLVNRLYGVRGSSGGLLEYIYRTAAKTLFGITIENGPLPMKTLRNSNFKEITLEDADGHPLLRFASVYGFRNIQALIQKLKRGKCPYDYVEVMACPSGCTNGGGQPTEIDNLIKKIEAAHHEGTTMRDPASNDSISAFLNLNLNTEYHKIIKSTHTAVVDW